MSDSNVDNNLKNILVSELKKECNILIKKYNINIKSNNILDKKVNEIELKIQNNNNNVYENFIILLSLYYDKYNIEKIINININKLFIKKIKVCKFELEEIKIPLKIYDVKENKIIIGRKNIKNKKFITISHRWNMDDKNININMLHKYKKINKLKQIYRKNNKLRYFWIDTICIDQNNNEEKESEIKNMKYYYKHSLMTIILNDINNNIVKSLNMSILSFDNNEIQKLFKMIINSIMIETPLKNDWHKRCWTLQESILNENIIIFTGIFLNLYSLKKIIYKTCFLYSYHNKLFELCFDMNNYKNSYKVGEVLKLMKNRKCSFPQDKIYSILGIIDDKISKNIIIDYKLNIKEIYINLFQEANKVNDYSWLNTAIDINYSNVDILYNKISINNNRLLFKSYIIKDIKKSIKIHNRKRFNIKKEIMINFDKKLININNINLNKNFWDILNYEDLIDTNKIWSIIINKNLKVREEDFVNYFNVYENFGLNPYYYTYLLIINEQQIGIIDIYNKHYKYHNESILVLNNYKNISENWWNCIVVEDNKSIGSGIINIDKKYLEQNNIEIELNLNNLINNNPNEIFLSMKMK